MSTWRVFYDKFIFEKGVLLNFLQIYTCFILDNIADDIFPPISKDIEKVCEMGIVFHKKIKRYKENRDLVWLNLL